ncbi:acyl-homoserine-lactone synthase [Vibrio aestuarianus]|uniref:acyl-homoserine-lactone synthase n=1 Tax=Vibrio aestuarianus TaxID=28171 RepID=UPI00237CC139|nr:acyl-homoserine-lactone synthase [Vibrio aestuarianus]MDE1310374.1 acyl-homoserine-lactone synthase [Vibrio aestuarianus]
MITDCTFNELDELNFYQLFNYRYEVFVKTLGWNLDLNKYQIINKIELDQFDNQDTVYIYRTNNSGEINGCARLLPTNKPYLLEMVFPELMSGAILPKEPSVWELSRFTSLDLNSSRKRQFDPFKSSGFLIEVFSVARKHGAKYLLSVSPVGIEKLLVKNRFRFTIIGNNIIFNGYELTVLLFNLDEYSNI